MNRRAFIKTLLQGTAAVVAGLAYAPRQLIDRTVPTAGLLDFACPSSQYNYRAQYVDGRVLLPYSVRGLKDLRIIYEHVQRAEHVMCGDSK